MTEDTALEFQALKGLPGPYMYVLTMNSLCHATLDLDHGAPSDDEPDLPRPVLYVHFDLTVQSLPCFLLTHCPTNPENTSLVHSATKG